MDVLKAAEVVRKLSCKQTPMNLKLTPCHFCVSQSSRPCCSFTGKRAKRSRAVWDTSTSLRARTLHELAKEKQTEKETAGSKTPRITVSLPSRTHSRPQKPPALLAPPTQWKHHRQPSQAAETETESTEMRTTHGLTAGTEQSEIMILYLVLFISCTNDCETHWNRFRITSPYLTRYSLGSREKHTSGSEQLCSPHTRHKRHNRPSSEWAMPHHMKRGFPPKLHKHNLHSSL